MMSPYTKRQMFQLRPHQQEVFSLMREHSRMLTVAPTSAGKTIMMIADAKHRFTEGESNQTILVVAPKLILCQQLSDEFEKFISNVNILHIHSGETKHTRITDSLELAYWHEKTEGHKLIFTTYHSLNKIVRAELDIDVVYLDECHNAVNGRFFDAVEAISKTAKNFYSLTATPKFSQVASKPGNNNAEVFGSKIHSVKAPELLLNGSILPPMTSVIEVGSSRDKETAHERDFYTLCDTIFNEDDMNKVLVVAPNTKVMMRMLSETSFMEEMHDNGYEVLHITSKYGSFVGNKKVTRLEFLKILFDYGKDPNRKFVVLHIGILTEGISVPGIQSCVLLRQQNFISTVQSIGRCIRVNPDDTDRMKSGELEPGDFENYIKPFGKVVIPVYNNKIGIATASRVQSVVDEVFVKGNFVADIIKK
jgi:superfamily II DNA or RNA helicase